MMRKNETEWINIEVMNINGLIFRKWQLIAWEMLYKTIIVIIYQNPLDCTIRVELAISTRYVSDSIKLIHVLKIK